jgi:hypothetical protein
VIDFGGSYLKIEKFANSAFCFSLSYITTWPGLTEAAINKHFKMTPATSMGHMNKKRQNICSTTKNDITSYLEDETFTPASLGTQNHFVYAVVIDQG